MKQLDIFTREESAVENRIITIPSFSSPSALEIFLTNLSIVDVGLYLKRGHFQKQKNGPNYRGLCLFHEERTPSLYLKPRGNWFMCYGCHETGGPLSFVRKVNLRFIDEIFQNCGLLLSTKTDPFHFDGRDPPRPGSYLDVFQSIVADEQLRIDSYRCPEL